MKYRFWITIAIVSLIIIPRIALVANGLDAQRIWDVNTPATFRLFEAVRSHRVLDFFATGQKYPLLGSFIHAPTVILNYAWHRMSGAYHSPEDFIDAYALGMSDIFLWIRIEMALLNLLALWLLWKSAKRFYGSALAGFLILLMSATNFYVTSFSVTPRIHSFAFLGTALTLYASGLALEKKTWPRILAAFGASAACASVAQSGFTTLLLPLCASLYDWEQKKIQLPRAQIRKIFFGLLLFGAVVVFIGYPRTFFWLQDRSIDFYSAVILGGDHAPPSFVLSWLPFSYLAISEYATLWLSFCALWYGCIHHRKKMLAISPLQWFALLHVVVFFALFGFTNVFSGRFLLVAMPTLFFFLTGVLLKLWNRRWIVAIFFLCIFVQAYGIVSLARMGFSGDTRADASEFLLSHSSSSDPIITNIDPAFLGIVETPEAVARIPASSRGINQSLIVEKQISGPKSGNIAYWVPWAQPLADDALRQYRFAAISFADRDVSAVEDQLLRSGFVNVKTIYATSDQTLDASSISWDIAMPISRIPLPLALSNIRVMGPTIAIYENTSL